MKQITFSNIVAVAALLLCFYAFTGEKSTRNQAEEKEYCSMIVRPYRSLLLTYSDGKTELVDYTSDKNDLWGTIPSTKKMEELSKEGWLFVEAVSIDGSNRQYLFERNK